MAYSVACVPKNNAGGVKNTLKKKKKIFSGKFIFRLAAD